MHHTSTKQFINGSVGIKNNPPSKAKAKTGVAVTPSGYSYAPERPLDVVYRRPSEVTSTMPTIRDVKPIEYDEKYIDVSLPCVDYTHENIPYRFHVGKQTVSYFYML